jgi:predicted component of type VI protein secretion system
VNLTLRVIDRRTQRAATRSFPYHGITIGRGLACDVVLEDPSVSRDHALLWQEGTSCHLRVLGRYGTQVAGQEVPMGGTAPVEPETEIRIGAYSLFVERPPGADAPIAAALGRAGARDPAGVGTDAVPATVPSGPGREGPCGP